MYPCLFTGFEYHLFLILHNLVNNSTSNLFSVFLNLQTVISYTPQASPLQTEATLTSEFFLLKAATLSPST